ncbi:phospholipase A1-like [Linepithema humile]|uniref:phospholipase A1-like n=1 Tax=Linepithema humile TaxID=83485 RepID=UPI00062369DC|nr:PREDICTED: phospholipase A1-like [Linepithema humile]
MKIITTVIITLLAQCVNLQPTFDLERMSRSCVFGVKSVSMILYNSEFPKGKVIELNETCDAIDPNKQIAFVTHGFISSANRSMSFKLASELYKKNYTVCALDWSDAACTNGIPLVKFLGYPSAVKNTREVGELLAKFIKLVIEECKCSRDNITLIGHSLGAHVSGFAAKNIQKWCKGNITRIIGLDPAAPFFSSNNCENRLCKTDADDVTIFRTSSLGMSLTYPVFSKREPLGDKNFQFDDGLNQPGCNIDVACSHSRAIEYLIDILEGNAFPSTLVSPSVALADHTSKFKSFLFSSPVCPNRNTTDCTFVDDKILTGDIDDGNYYICVNKNSPYSVKENSFSCQQ